MKNNASANFTGIDIGDMFDISNPVSIRNFHLSHPGREARFFKSGTSFIFNGFAISLCHGGSCSLKMNGNEYRISGNAVLVFSPNQLIEMQSVSEDFTAESISVSFDVILEFPSPVDINIINSAIRKPVVPISEADMARLLEYHGFIRRRYAETANAYREEISKTLLYALMLEICNMLRTASGDEEDVSRPRQEKLTDDFFKLLIRHFRTEHNVGFYADKLNRTPKYLSSAIKRLSGRSVPDWINSTLISEIKLMLKVTDKTILEISEDLNFSSPSVFVQFFRHNTGITPLQYRKQP